MAGIKELLFVRFSHFFYHRTARSAPGLNLQRAPRSQGESPHSQRIVGGGGADMQRLYSAQEK